MFYPKIIINSLFSLLSINKIFIFIIFSYLFFLSWKNISKINNNYKFILIAIRFLIILLIIPIFNNDNFKFEDYKEEKQNIGLIVDNSISIEKSHSINEINNILDSIFIWSNKNNVNLFFYNLDSIIKRNDLVLNRKSTDFDSFSKFYISNNLDQIILLSDGNINSGFFTNAFNLPDKIILNTIGLGSDKNQIININDVTIKNIKDSIFSKLKFYVDLSSYDEEVVLNIYSNNYDNKIYSDSLLIIKGNYFFEEEVNFSNSINADKLIFKLDPITYINTEMYNTSWMVDLSNFNQDKVLLLTGSINYNTKFLKDILKDNVDINLTHHFFLNEENNEIFNLKDFNCIILDNFPISDKQFLFLDEIYSLDNIPIIFFEGIDSKSNYIDSIFSNLYKDDFYLTNSVNSKNFFLNGIDIGPINAKYNLFANNNLESESSTFFSNNSIALFNSNNFYLFLIPNIAEVDFFFRNKYSNDYLSSYISFLINQHISNRLINFKLSKYDYLKGEKLSFLVDYKIPLECKSKKIVIKDIKRNIVDSLIYDGQDIFLNNSGNYEVYFLYEGTNREIINSNIEEFSVNEDNIEFDKISQNIFFLKEISNKFNGKYIDVDDFNNNYFYNFDTSLNYKKYNDIFSSLDVFISEKIYLLVIILLSLEIYLRKRNGLL